MSGQQELDNLTQAGFSQQEVGAYEAQQRQQLSTAGFNNEEIDAHFGKKPMSDAPLQAHFDAAIGAAAKEAKGDPATGAPAKPFTFEDAFEAGWQHSVSGLEYRKKVPDKTLPADAAWYDRLAFNTASLAGDAPSMALGFGVGALGGSVTGPGALITGTGGAFAMPAAMRGVMMDAYGKGEVKTPGEFIQRAGGIMLDTAKNYVTGAATAGAGILTAGALPAATSTLGAIGTKGAVTAAQVATMATASRTMEGQLPHAQDFLDAALVVGVMHAVPFAAGKVADTAGKLRDIYAQTNKAPAEVINDMQADPTIKQDLLSDNIAIPKSYAAAVDPHFKPEAAAPAEPAATPPEAPPEGTPEAAQANILSKIQVGGGDKGPGLTFDKFYTNMVDDLHPIKQAVDALTGGEELPASQDPYILARLTRGAAGRADQFLTQAPFDYNTLENTGKSLKTILEPVKSDLDAFRAFVVAKRAMELEGRGIASGFDPKDANRVISSGEAKYGKAASELVDYQDSVTKYLRDSGVISDKAYSAMLDANKHYVPFYRVLDHLTGGGPKTAKGLQATDPLKAIKGSDKGVVDPIESIIKNTYTYTAIADRNAVGRTFIDLAKKSDMPEMAKKISPDIVGTKVTDAEMTKYLQDNGIDDVPEDLLTIFRARRNPLADNQIAVFENGKRSVYELPDDVAAAFKSADRETAGWLFKLIAAPTKFFRAGVTLSPDFFPRNIVRDQFDALINSRNGFVPLLDTVRGAASLVAKDADYQNWLKSGGANAALVSLDRQYLQSRVFQLNNETGDWIGKTWNVVKSPLEALRVVSELAENATRVGEFKKAYNSNIDKGFDAKDSILDAGYQSREVTLDFSRTGAKTRALNQIIAFWNAQVQGIDRIARRAKEDPLGTSAKIASAITLPSVLLWYANHNDPRYNDVPDWQKDMFWIVMTKDNIYRIPKPHELGVLFASGVERFLDYTASANPKSLQHYASNLAQTFAPGFVPNVAQPVVEQFANKSLFTGAPIVPANVEDKLPEYQYSPYTSELTKAVGHLVGTVPFMHDSPAASPALIDNYVRQWSGGLGVYTLQLADAALRKTGVLPDPVQPASTLADIPIIKAFIVRNPSAGMQPIQDFYNDYADRKKVINTVRYLAKEGDAVNAMREAHLSPNAMVNLDGIHTALSNQQKLIQLIWKNPQIDAVQKRQIIDATYYRMLAIAKAGNAQIKNIDASMAR